MCENQTVGAVEGAGALLLIGAKVDVYLSGSDLHVADGTVRP